MSWITDNGVADSTVNILTDSGYAILYHLKELLKAAGWSVLMSGDGLSSYNASGDTITHSGSGANGMGNSTAWFRITDPGSRREYVFQAQALDYNLIWHYSALDKFTGGSPNATTIPTAADTQGLAKRNVTAQAMLPTQYSYICSMAAQDTAEGNVYDWWLTVRTPNTTDFESIWACASIDEDSNPGDADTDPCIHIGTDDSSIYTDWENAVATGTDDWVGYMCHDGSGGGVEEWQGLSLLAYSTASPDAVPGAMGPNPHTGNWPLLEIHVARHSSTGSTTGVKGILKHYKWKPNANTHSYPMEYYDSENSINYIIYEDICFPGWPLDISPRM